MVRNMVLLRPKRPEKIAESKGLDLVEISPKAKPPVVKLIDYGKYKYQIQKKANEAKKKQIVIAIKEIKFRPNIDQHDLNVKLKKIFNFLEQGDKVKLVMQFRGREMSRKEVGLEKFKNILTQVLTSGSTVESPLKMMGNRAITVVAPNKTKKSKNKKDIKKA